MHIVFICGCVEPGRDGVGDYTRRLSAELKKNGHQAEIIAINDHYAPTEVMELQQTDGTSVDVYRIPTAYPGKARFKILNQTLKLLQPTVISIQYVPFSFNPKGLPFLLGMKLRNMGKESKWHIMFHELWLGLDKESSVKWLIWGYVQKLLISSLIRSLRPILIHTHTTLYERILKSMQQKPVYLPLFSNIPVSYPKALGFHNTGLKQLNFVLFGGMYPGAPIEQLADEVSQYSRREQVNIKLQLIGRSGAEKEVWKKSWESYGLEIESLGECTPMEISKIFSEATFGISTTPAWLIEKSGSAAAMLEHGLPVLCISRSWEPRRDAELVLPEGIIPYKKGVIGDLLMRIHSFEPKNGISQVTKQFISDISGRIRAANI